MREIGDDMNEIIDRLARLLVLRMVDVHNAQDLRPVDRKLAGARLDGAADAVYRVVNAYGPEQVLRVAREVVGEGRRITAGGHRVWFEERADLVAERLRIIYRDEE